MINSKIADKLIKHGLDKYFICDDVNKAIELAFIRASNSNQEKKCVLLSPAAGLGLSNVNMIREIFIEKYMLLKNAYEIKS